MLSFSLPVTMWIAIGIAALFVAAGLEDVVQRVRRRAAKRAEYRNDVHSIARVVARDLDADAETPPR